MPKDFLNREIKLGDICVYPVRRGSKMWLNRIVVQKISYNLNNEPLISGLKQDGFPVNISALDRIVIVGRNNTISVE